VTSLLITGGAGFVALHAAEIALSRGHGVRMLDVRKPEPEFLDMIAGSDFIEGDIRDEDALARAMDGCDAAIHCAAIVGPAAGKADPLRAVDVNVKGTAKLLEAARKRSARVINMSTATLYGNRPNLEPLDEYDPPDPVSIYDASKLMSETLCASYRKTFGVVVSSIRTGFVYGYGSRIGQYFVPAALEGRTVNEKIGGDHPCDFTYVVDLARALVDAAEAPRLPEPVYNVSNGRLQLRRAFAQAVRSALPDADINAGEGIDPDRHLRGPSITVRAQRDFGYASRFSLEEGVADWVSRARKGAAPQSASR